MRRVIGYGFLSFLFLAACGMQDLFTQKDKKADEKTLTTAAEDEELDGAYVEYPEGLLPEGVVVDLVPGAEVASTSTVDALAIDTEIQAVGPSVNLSASGGDVPDTDASRLVLNVPLPGSNGLALANYDLLVVFFHVRRSDGTFRYGVIVRDDLEVDETFARFRSRGLGNYQAATLSRKITETKEVETTAEVETKEQAEAITGTYELELSFPAQPRDVYLVSEVAHRTVSITHDGESLECSRDGGATFGSCASSSTLVWRVADYNKKHVVRVSGSAKNSESVSFTPSAKAPGLEFLSCDYNITTSMDFDTFLTTTSGLGSASVICIEDGVTVAWDLVEDSNPTLTFASDDITLIAPSGATVTFSSATGSPLFDTAGSDNLRFIGLTCNHTNTAACLKIYNASANPIENIEVAYSSFTAAAGTDAVYMFRSGTNSSPIVIRDSTITNTDTGSGTALYSSMSYAKIFRSTIKAHYLPVGVYNGSTLNFSDSNLVQAYDDVSVLGAIQISKDSHVKLSNSFVQIDGGTAVEFLGHVSSGAESTLQTENVLYIRNNVSNTDRPVFYLDSTSSNAGFAFKINSSNNGNQFCQKSNTAGERFSAVVEYVNPGDSSTPGSFVLANQINGGVIGSCPANTPSL